MKSHTAAGFLALVLAVAIVTAGCGGGTSHSPSAKTNTSDPASAPSASVGAVDPQILSDVAAGAFPLPGPTELRTMRITLASIGYPNAACGGENFSNLNDTSLRLDQARYADLQLIAKKGLSQPEPPLPPRMSASCLAKQTPAFSAWHALAGAWQDATLTAANSAPVVATHAKTASCLRKATGLAVSVGDPTAAYLNKVDYALSGVGGTQWTVLERKFSLAYARCAQSYFAAMARQLRPVKRRLIERNRELLERYASELAALGYVP
jgi:hypothetical protein